MIESDLGGQHPLRCRSEGATKEATRAMHIRAFAPLACLVWFAHTAAGNSQEFAQSYTSEELHRMAALYKQIVEGTPLDNMDQYFMAFQFRGYVAATLDHLSIGAEQINECAGKYSLDEIVARSAIMIESTPSNKAMIAAVEVNSAIIVACDAVKAQR